MSREKHKKKSLKNKDLEKKLERIDGIEPSSLDWKSKVIPLYDIRLDDEGQLRERVERERCHPSSLFYSNIKLLESQEFLASLCADEVVSTTLRVHPLPNVSKVDSFS